MAATLIVRARERSRLLRVLREAARSLPPAAAEVVGRDYCSARFGVPATMRLLVHPSRPPARRHDVRTRRTPGPVTSLRRHLARYVVVEVASGVDVEQLRMTLAHDRDVARVFVPPVIRLVPPAQAPPLLVDGTWGTTVCGFSDIWAQGYDRPGGRPIVFIDSGTLGFDNPEFDARPPEHVPGIDPHNHGSAHAAGVAAVAVAGRVPPAAGSPRLAVDGCCSAQAVVHDTAAAGSADLRYDAVCRGLCDAADRGASVVNMSFDVEPTATDDQLAPLRHALAYCTARGVALVAAVGEVGAHTERPTFPCSESDVLPVQGMLTEAEALPGSIPLNRRFIAAPGRVVSVVNDTRCDRMSGSSYAAPFVSAALWLLRRCAPTLTPREAVDTLCAHATRPNRPNNGLLGCGRVDVRFLLQKYPPPDGQPS